MTTMIELAKRAWQTLRTHKYMWLFGFFAAAGTGSGAQASGSNGAAGAAGDLPSWLIPVLIAASLAAIAASLAHVISEGALIEVVKRSQQDQPHDLRTGFRTGLSCFWRVLGLKVIVVLVAIVIMGAAATPGVLAAIGMFPTWAGAVASILLGLPAVPVLLTVYFIYKYALRFAVLEDAGVMAAVNRARGFLHGRIVYSLKLLVTDGLGRAVASSVGAAVVLVVGGSVGLLVYAAAGLVPALVVGGVLAAPVALALTGIIGTYQSAIWTIGYLEERSI